MAAATEELSATAKLEAIKVELEMARGVQEASGLPAVREMLKTLTRREPVVLSLVDAFRRSGDSAAQHDAERVLEAVMAEMARLIDAAGSLAERAALAATGGGGSGSQVAADSAAAQPVRSMTGSGASSGPTDTASTPKERHHKHHHKHHHRRHESKKAASPSPAAQPTSTPAPQQQQPTSPVPTTTTPTTPAPAAPAPQSPGQLAQVDKMTDETRALMAGPPEIPPEEIELADLIGTGAFGKVYRGRVRGKPVAVKV